MKNWKVWIAAVAVAATVGVQGTPQASDAKTGVPVTIEGCVVREADAPGRTPPEDIRGAVIASDNYVLHGVAIVKGEAPAGMPAGAMFMVRDIKKLELKAQVGRRVQIDGTLDKVERVKNKIVYAHALAEVKGTSIRMATGACK